MMKDLPGDASRGHLNTKSGVAIASSAVSDAGGSAEGKDKAREELNAITAGTRPNMFL